MRLIDADAIPYEPLPKGDRNYRTYNLDDAYEDGYNDAMVDVRNAPTIEERKKGKWTPKEERQKQEIFICSECGGWAYSPWIGSRKNPKPNRCKYNFCPNCGSYNGGET